MGLQTGAFKRLQEQGQEWVRGATIDHIFLALGDLLQVAVERCLLQNASIATLTPKWPIQLTDHAIGAHHSLILLIVKESVARGLLLLFTRKLGNSLCRATDKVPAVF